MKSIIHYGSLLGLLFSLSVIASENSWDKPKESYEGNLDITVYRSPSCGCCGGWIEHLKKHGFNVEDVQNDDLSGIKNYYGVPGQMASCHTAVIDGYVIEGHVPADDIKRLLKQRPNVVGISVPQMPVGTPGMEMGNRKDAFDVIQFDKEGKASVFNRYETY